MTTQTAQKSPSPYVFKSARYSSHSLLLATMPPPGRGRRVLDVGGGEGYLSRILAQRGYQVTCIARHGSRAEDFPAGVELVEVDLDLEYPRFSSTFDFVLCGDILEHLREPANALRWLRRLLAPGGLLVLSMPNSGHVYVRLNVLLGRIPLRDRGPFDRTHLHFLTWSGWQQILAEGGFRIETVEPTSTPFGSAMGLESNVAVRMLEGLSYALGRLWKTLFAYQFVVTARPRGIAE